MDVLAQTVANKYAMYNGDSCELIKNIPDNSIHYTIFSPPFASLYTYSNICMSENIATERANFRMIYNELAKRKKEDSQIPERLRKTISSIGIEKNINNDYQKFKAALEELGKELEQ